MVAEPVTSSGTDPPPHWLLACNQAQCDPITALWLWRSDQQPVLVTAETSGSFKHTLLLLPPPPRVSLLPSGNPIHSVRKLTLLKRRQVEKQLPFIPSLPSGPSVFSPPHPPPSPPKPPPRCSKPPYISLHTRPGDGDFLGVENEFPGYRP